MLLKKGTK